VKAVGKGSFGAVSEIQRLSDGQLFALKEVDVKSMGQAERQACVEEVRLLASVSHPNVLAYNEALIENNKLCIIMEYAPDGDIRKIIQKAQQAKKAPPEDLVWKIFIQIVQGLEALHSLKILHRDIKPGNIMLMANDVVKIGDLGVAKVLKNSPLTNTQIGTPYYMAPEIWRTRPYTYSCDTFSLGCLLYELISTKLPFEARSLGELSKRITSGSYPPLPSSVNRELSSLVTACLNVDPGRRPTMTQILNNPSLVSRLHLLPPEVVARPDSSHGSVLNTIKVPRGGNLAAIQEALPPANYAMEEEKRSKEEAAAARPSSRDAAPKPAASAQAARPAGAGGSAAAAAPGGMGGRHPAVAGLAAKHPAPPSVAAGAGARPVSRPGPAPGPSKAYQSPPWSGAAVGAAKAALRPPPTPSAGAVPPPAGAARPPARPSSAYQQQQPPPSRGGQPQNLPRPGSAAAVAPPPGMQHMRLGLGAGAPAQQRKPPAGAAGGAPRSAYNRNISGAQPANGVNGIMGGVNGLGLAKQQAAAGVRRPISAPKR